MYQIEIDGINPVIVEVDEEFVTFSQNSDHIKIPCVFFRKFNNQLYEFSLSDENVSRYQDILITRESISRYELITTNNRIELDDEQIEELASQLANFGIE